MNHKRNSFVAELYAPLTRLVDPWNECVSIILSAPPGDGCVGTSILPREAAGTIFPKRVKD